MAPRIPEAMRRRMAKDEKALADMHEADAQAEAEAAKLHPTELATIFAFFDALKKQGMVVPHVARLRAHIEGLEEERDRWLDRLGNLQADAVASDVVFDDDTTTTEDLLQHCYAAYPATSAAWILAERYEYAVSSAQDVIKGLSARRFRIAKLNVGGKVFDGVILAEDAGSGDE